jgi:hypothetical protein
MDLRQLLRSDFGKDFPISGGFGNSKDNTIIIHRQEPNDYTSIEYSILRCLGIGRKIEWKLIKQTLLNFNGRTLDQLKIETTELADTEVISQIENYYFDITECIRP